LVGGGGGEGGGGGGEDGGGGGLEGGGGEKGGGGFGGVMVTIAAEIALAGRPSEVPTEADRSLAPLALEVAPATAATGSMMTWVIATVADTDTGTVAACPRLPFPRQ
jgi:hypothetical protein